MQTTPTTPRPLLLLGLLITVAGLTLLALVGTAWPLSHESARPASTAIRAMQSADQSFPWMLEE